MQPFPRPHPSRITDRPNLPRSSLVLVICLGRRRYLLPPHIVVCLNLVLFHPLLLPTLASIRATSVYAAMIARTDSSLIQPRLLPQTCYRVFQYRTRSSGLPHTKESARVFAYSQPLRRRHPNPKRTYWKHSGPNIKAWEGHGRSGLHLALTPNYQENCMFIWRECQNLQGA